MSNQGIILTKSGVLTETNNNPKNLLVFSLSDMPLYIRFLSVDEGRRQRVGRAQEAGEDKVRGGKLEINISNICVKIMYCKLGWNLCVIFYTIWLAFTEMVFCSDLHDVFPKYLETNRCLYNC